MESGMKHVNMSCFDNNVFVYNVKKSADQNDPQI